MFHLLLVDFLFGPLEGGGVLIPASDKGFDCLYQHFDAGKAGSLQCAAAQNAKPAFHLIEPGAVCRDEMKMHSLDAPISDDDSTEFGEIVGDEDAQTPFESFRDRNMRDELS